jgi:hypothetical protein
MKKQTLSMHKVARDVLDYIAKSKLRRHDKEKRAEIVADALARVFTPEQLSNIGNVGFYFVPFCDALLQPQDKNVYRIFGLCKRELENARKMRYRKDGRVIEETQNSDVQRLLTRPSETPLAGIEREERERAEEARLQIEAAENEMLRQALLDWYFRSNTSRERETLLQLINTDLSDREINALTGMARPNVSKLRKNLYAMADRYLTDDPGEQPESQAPEFKLYTDNEESSEDIATVSGNDDTADVSTTGKALDLGNGNFRTRAVKHSAEHIRGPASIDIEVARYLGGEPGRSRRDRPRKYVKREGRDSKGTRKHNVAMMQAYASDGTLRDLAKQKKQESRLKKQEAKALDRDAFLLNLAAKHGISPQELRRLTALCEQADLSLDKVLAMALTQRGAA